MEIAVFKFYKKFSQSKADFIMQDFVDKLYELILAHAPAGTNICVEIECRIDEEDYHALNNINQRITDTTERSFNIKINRIHKNGNTSKLFIQND